MVDRVFYSGLMALLFLLAALLFIACGGGGAGLSRAEVEEIVRSELADAPAPEPGLTAAEVEEAIRRAMADMPQPEAGLTENEVEEIVKAAVATIPSATCRSAFRVDSELRMHIRNTGHRDRPFGPAIVCGLPC